MDRDIAIRIDASLVNAIGNLDMISDFMKRNMPAEDFSKYAPYIGHCMYKLTEFSEEIRVSHADIASGNLKRDL